MKLHYNYNLSSFRFYIIVSRMSSAEKIIESFPHKVLTPIVGLPVFEAISTAHLDMNIF